MEVVNKPASWMVNLKLGVGKGPGDWPFFCCKQVTNFIIRLYMYS